MKAKKSDEIIYKIIYKTFFWSKYLVHDIYMIFWGMSTLINENIV